MIHAVQQASKKNHLKTVNPFPSNSYNQIFEVLLNVLIFTEPFTMHCANNLS